MNISAILLVGAFIHGQNTHVFRCNNKQNICTYTVYTYSYSPQEKQYLTESGSRDTAVGKVI